MHHFARISSALLFSLCVASPPVSAFETSLSDEAVREAYFLGQRRDEKTALFFETYRHYFPVPNSGPHVYMVEVFTPFQKWRLPTNWKVPAFTSATDLTHAAMTHRSGPKSMCKISRSSAGQSCASSMQTRSHINRSDSSRTASRRSGSLR